MILPNFEDLTFGELDAPEEARKYPELLINGFYDHRNAAWEIEQGNAFLLLGAKGAGKSAVLEHLRLKHEDTKQLHFHYWDLRGFPLADVRNVKTGQSPGLGRTQSSWELILLLRLVQELKKDGSSANGSSLFGRMWRDLERSGLVTGDWRTQVIQWSKATAKISLPFAAEVGAEVSSNQVQLFQMAEAIKGVLEQTSVIRKHIIALDGLDLLFFETENKRQSLSGLVEALRSLNLWAIEPGNIPASFVCCLRSDMFNRIGSSETSKYVGKAVTLDWARNWEESDELWSLIDGKVAVKNRGITLRRTYLSGTVPVGDGYRAADKFILDTLVCFRGTS